MCKFREEGNFLIFNNVSKWKEFTWSLVSDEDYLL